MQIRWTLRALSHLRELQDYIARDNPGAAYRVAQTIRTRVSQLAAQPYSGRPGRVEGTRELVVANTPYIVAYRVSDQSIDILSVLHASRKWPESF